MHNPNAPDYTPRMNPAVYGSMDTPSAAHTPIDDELKRISGAIERLNTVIEMLSKRLDYYLVQPQPRPNNDAGMPIASSPMSQALQRINIDLYALEDRLRDIYERIER